MVVDASPEIAWYTRLAVVVAPGPDPDPALDAERLASHREFYLKSSHTVVPSGSRLRYRSALGQLTYRAQLGLLFDETPRHTPRGRILGHVHGVVLTAELLSIDLLRVGWEGTMWHVRYGEGASFDDSCVVTAEVREPAGVVGAAIQLTDPSGTTDVDWTRVAETCARVTDWMALRPDMLLLAGSRHGPVLSIDGTDAVLRFPPTEPRIGPGDDVTVSSPQLGVVRATVTADRGEEG